MAAPPAPGRPHLNRGGELACAKGELALAYGGKAASCFLSELARRIVGPTSRYSDPTAAERCLVAPALSRPRPPPQQPQGTGLPPQPAGLIRRICGSGPFGVPPLLVRGTGNRLVGTRVEPEGGGAEKVVEVGGRVVELNGATTPTRTRTRTNTSPCDTKASAAG